jgi:hypothetical protein
MADAVSGIIEQRLRQTQVANQMQEAQARLQQTQAALAQSAQEHAETLASATQDRLARQAEAKSRDASETSNREFAAANAFGEQIPAGTSIPTTDPIVPILQRTGRMGLLRTQQATPDQPMVGPLEPGQDMRPTVPGTGTPEQYIKQASAKQQETEAAQTERALRDQQLATMGQENTELRRQLGQGTNDLGWARMQAAQAAADAKAAAAGTKATTLVPSAEGKRKLSSLNQSAMLTDKVLAQIKQQYPDIETDTTGKYNTLGAKSESAWAALNQGLGFAADNPNEDARIQMTNLLKGAEAGQYARGTNQQFVQGALQALPDKTQTLRAQYDRLKQLKSLYPQLATGIIQGEQPIDLTDPLKNYYFGGAGPNAAPSNMIHARDLQGKLHQAPAGSALPPGWKLEQP